MVPLNNFSISSVVSSITTNGASFHFFGVRIFLSPIEFRIKTNPFIPRRATVTTPFHSHSVPHCSHNCHIAQDFLVPNVPKPFASFSAIPSCISLQSRGGCKYVESIRRVWIKKKKNAKPLYLVITKADYVVLIKIPVNFRDNVKHVSKGISKRIDTKLPIILGSSLGLNPLKYVDHY